MATALGSALEAAGSRRVALRAAAMQTAKPSGGGGAGGLYGAWAGSNDPWSAADNVARLYAMASRGEAYSAIRPACVKMANLVVRVGERDEAGGLANREMRIREKAYAGDELAASRDLRHRAWLKTAPAFVKSLEESVEVLEDHPFLRRLARPNDYQTASSLMWCTAFSLCACGESIWLLDYDETAKDLAAIYYLPRTWVTPVEHGGNPFAFYRLTVPGQFADPENPPIPGRFVMHVMTPNAANPVVPHSSTAAQGLAIATDAEIQTAQLAVTKNITKPGMLVVVGEVESAVGGKSQRPELTADQRRDIAAQVRLHYQTASRVGDPLVLDRLIQDVRPYMPQPSDLDYQGGSSVISARIYQGYGTNPIVAGQVQSGNRAQALVAHESLDWLQVNPLATLIGEAMTAKIGPLYGTEDASKSLVIWIDPARAKDPELMQKRFESVAKFGVLTKGQMREYLATGEYEYVPQDDDEEPAKAPGGAAGGEGQPGANPGDPNADPNAAPPADPSVDPAVGGPAAKRSDRKKRRQQAKALGLGGGMAVGRVYVVPEDGVKAARRVLRWLRDGALESLDSKSLAMARMLARGVVTSRGALKRLAASMAELSAGVREARERVNAESLNAWESPEIVKWLSRGGAVTGAWACASLGDVQGADEILGSWTKGGSLGNCGTGAGGFKPGNTCSGGGASSPLKVSNALGAISASGSDALSVEATARDVFGVSVSMSGKALTKESLDSIAQSRGLPNGLGDLKSDVRKKVLALKTAKAQMESLALRREVIAKKMTPFTADVLSRETPPPPDLSSVSTARPVTKVVVQEKTGTTLSYRGYDDDDADMKEANTVRLKHSEEVFNAEFTRMSAKHAGLKDIGVEVEIVNGNMVKNPKTGSLILGYYDRQSKKVVVAASYQTEATAPLTIGQNKVDFSKTGVLRHEVGHRVQASLPEGTSKKWESIAATVDWSKVSGYAVNTGKQSELFAESYAAFLHKDYKSGMLPQQIESFMSELIGS